MKKFGFKAFLRALTIFVCIYLVKFGIEVVRETNDTFLKIGYVIGLFVAILLIMILPGILFPTKRELPGKDRKPNNEKADR